MHSEKTSKLKHDNLRSFSRCSPLYLKLKSVSLSISFCAYRRLSLPSEPMMVPVVVVEEEEVDEEVEVGVVVEPVFMVGMTAADSFSRSLLSSDQYLVIRGEGNF